MTPKFDRELIQLILNDILEYVPISIACLKNGISYRRFKDWRLMGENDLYHGELTDHAQMVIALNTIFADLIKENVNKIKFCPKGHLGAQYMLSTRFNRYFSVRAEVLEMHDRLDEMDISNKKDLSDEINSIKAPKNPNK